MRIDSGLQGYYYDQNRSKRTDVDNEQPAAAPAPQQTRAQPANVPQVENSTVLSNSLSSALWALETIRHQRQRGGTTDANAAHASDQSAPDETADIVSAFYMQYGSEDTVAA